MFGLKRLDRVLKWTSNVFLKKESPVVLRWIRLPQLPSNFYALSCLAAIGEHIEKLIRADERTLNKELSLFARICIAIDIIG